MIDVEVVDITNEKYDPKFKLCGETDYNGRQLWCGSCAKCGRTAKIPFRPHLGKGEIYCRNCLPSMRDKL